MEDVAKGVDIHGILNIDHILSGDLPVIPEHAEIMVFPYTEEYIQTGPGTGTPFFLFSINIFISKNAFMSLVF